MAAVDVIDDLASQGRYHFTMKEAVDRLGVSVIAARASIRRLKSKGLVAAPHRGFYVVVPPEYRRLGCLPADQFIPQLMQHLGLSYYAALLTAGRYHGAAHQQPQVFQVMVAQNRPPIACGEVRVSFVARRNAADVPTMNFKTPRGYLAVSTPEATAFDLVGYPQHSGGVDNVATVLAELAEQLDPAALASLAPLSPVPWAQRLGFLLERIGAADRAIQLARHVAGVVNETTALVPSAPVEGAPYDKRWRLLINVQVEPDL
ncbi:MAG TPA: type IV toxin-antitoxin system AbiEi family antitoxin [Candidatus Fermentibacter daniensis]|nr:type IV toxin-antitoxin system AbiEi family antitoxin [Candidatus Fermentibacter daniensis]HQM40133.1 type IV toxin-antitoxin system AbiEi family antitoxin [Candidatus Fermentibacter daniensis]